MNPKTLIRQRLGMALLTLAATMAPNAFAAEGKTAAADWTNEQFPAYIRRLNYFGERPDWSHDGKRILFIEKSYGDVFEIEIETGVIRPLTHHYHHGGYVRALYLSNGDVLLSGPRSFSPDNWQEARFRDAELWILSKNRDKPPTRLGEYCWEGPCASRKHLRIAWAEHHGLYPHQTRLYQIWVADLDYSSGAPRIANQRVILDNTRGEIKGAVLEPQSFRLPDEKELTVQSSHDGTEVMGFNLETGQWINYSKSPRTYDEPEGIFPDGQWTLVESSRHSTKSRGGDFIDLWKLKLDESRTWERLTWFNERGRFKASNPVVSDDGRFIAFTVPRIGDVAGVGHGIYIYDIAQAEAVKAGRKP